MKSPIKGTLLRVPGASLDEEIDPLTRERDFEYLIRAAAFFASAWMGGGRPSGAIGSVGESDKRLHGHLAFSRFDS